MLGRGIAAAVATLSIVAATAGCGLGPGESTEGVATLKITSAYGSQPILSRSESGPNASETVLRFLDRSTDITTRYGGGFVQSIDGLAGSSAGSRRHDWFFFVNGIESSLGAAQVAVKGGDRIWWDYRDWTDALRAPAVVGSWPEPFAQTSAGADAKPVQVVCFAEGTPLCDDAAARLADAGVDATQVAGDEPVNHEALRLLVGPWHLVEKDPAAAQIDDGPSASGVFVRFDDDGDGLVGLDERGEDAAKLGPNAGLVAAVRLGDDPPTFVATGLGEAGVAAAVDALDESALRDHYAVGVVDGDVTPLPVQAVQ